MTHPILNFAHLTPAERIELAEQLWDSLPIEEHQPSELDTAELRRRRAELAADHNLGEPWESVLKEIGERGA